MNKNHAKKVIAPVVVSLILAGYYLSIGFVLLKFDFPIFIKVIVLIASILLTGVVIMVLVQRLKEIKGGVEDDLGKY